MIIIMMMIILIKIIIMLAIIITIIATTEIVIKIMITIIVIQHNHNVLPKNQRKGEKLTGSLKRKRCLEEDAESKTQQQPDYDKNF